MFPRLSWTHWAEDDRVESGLQGFVRFYMENTDGAQLPLDTQLPTYICLTTFWHYSKWAAILKNNSIAQIQAINFAQLLNQLKPNKWSQCKFLAFSYIFLFLPKPIQIKRWSLPSSPTNSCAKWCTWVLYRQFAVWSIVSSWISHITAHFAECLEQMSIYTAATHHCLPWTGM